MNVSRSTPIGTPVLADVDEYPRGYAQGNPRSATVARGKLYAIEGDAGLAWCLVRLDDPGDGPEFMHVPMDRVTVDAALTQTHRADGLPCHTYRESDFNNPEAQCQACGQRATGEDSFAVCPARATEGEGTVETNDDLLMTAQLKAESCREALDDFRRRQELDGNGDEGNEDRLYRAFTALDTLDGAIGDLVP